MSLWLVLGFGWLAVSIVLGVFSMRKGFGSFITWLIFGAAMMAFHLQMHETRFASVSNMKQFNFVLLLFSVLMWFGTFWYTVRRSFNPD